MIGGDRISTRFLAAALAVTGLAPWALTWASRGFVAHST